MYSVMSAGGTILDVMGDSSTFDKVGISGIKGYYTENKTYTLNETGYMQYINWLL